MTLATLFQQLLPHTIHTLAGVGYRTGIPAREADAGWPMGVVRRPDGDLIVVDYHAHRLWRIDQTGILHPFAGDGIPGNSGDGGPASAARFYWPHDLTQDQFGNLYVADLGNQVIRRIDYQTGIITRVAGSGQVGRGGDGGSALEAELDTTCGVAVDQAGNLYLSSEWANNLRRVDAATGIITTFAGQNARYYPAEREASRPYGGPRVSFMGYHGDGGPATEAAFRHPEHLAFDRGCRHLYVCDNSNDRVRRIDMQNGLITTVLGNGQRASNGDGGPAHEASTLQPDAICLDGQNNLYVGEKYGYRVRKVEAATGIVRTLVGNGVPGFGEEGLPGSQTHCNSVEAGIWADPDGTVYWGDCSGRLRRYDGQTGLVTTVLGGTSVHDGEAATAGFLNGPGGLAVGPQGEIYIADVWNQRIRRIDANGLIHTVAGNGARAFGGDNEAATAAYLGNPHDVAVDSQGRILIADTRNGRIRRIERDGTIRTLAGTTLPWDGGEGRWDKGDGGPAVSACIAHVEAVAVGPNDDIYLGDSAVGRIRKIDARTGIITTVAGIGLPGYTGDGGPATQARIGAPTAIRFDVAGALYFTDRTYHVVRRVDPAGLISTVVGCGQAGFSPDGTPAQTAHLDQPWGLAIAPAGTLYIADSRHNCVRRVTAQGTLETVAGGATAGDGADGDLATHTCLNEPHGLCLYGPDILLISDHYNNRVKAVKL